MMQQFNALQAIQAGEAGAASREKRERKNAFSESAKMYGAGDYSGASQALAPFDPSASMQMADMGRQRAQGDEQEQMRKIYGATQLLVKEPDVMKRIQLAQQMSPGLGIPAPTDPSDYTDDALQRELDEMRIKGGFEVEAPEAYTLAPGARRFVGDQMVAENPKETMPQGPASPIGKIMADVQAGLITEEQGRAAIERANAPRGPLAQVTVGEPTAGQRPIVNKPPSGFQRVWDGENQTYRDMPIPGSEAAREAQIAQDKTTSRNDPTTIDSLVGSYATLNKNTAIRSMQNSAGDNAAAMYSASPPGRFQDALGGDIGNAGNDAARDNIEGISMNMLMKMISMSDVSAKAMDSDAEMRAWLSAIKGDQYESALTKLHVLDVSFGSGQALQRAFRNGKIDQATYEYVTQRANSDPMAVEMTNRMQRYAALEGSVGAENLTPSEAAELEELRAWKAAQNAE